MIGGWRIFPETATERIGSAPGQTAPPYLHHGRQWFDATDLHPYDLPMITLADIDSTTVLAVRAFILKIAERYDFVDAFLFGSRARNTHQIESDADVAVVLRGSPGKFVATKLAMDDIAYDVLLDTGIRIQPFPIWEAEWVRPEAYSNPRLLHNIEREGLRL